MFYRLAVIIFVFICPSLFGQSPEEVHPVSVIDTVISGKSQQLDSLTIVGTQKLDSIQGLAWTQYNSLMNSYDSIVNSADRVINKLNNRLDSLRNINLPTDKITNTLDSINQWKSEQLKTISTKVDKLKSDVQHKVSSLELPPQLQEQASKLTSMMDRLDVSLSSNELTLSFQDKLDLPTLSNPLNSTNLSSVSGIDIPSTDINVPSVGSELNQLQGQLPQVPTTLDDATKLAEDQATKIATVSDVQKELGQVTEIQNMTGALKDQEAMKMELIQQAQQQAMNHFAGKEEQLKKAMQTVSKYKQKYSSLESLSDIPKRHPNKMRGKPFVERLTPGVALQIFRKDYWMVDLNPYVGYKFNGKLTAGMGWNQRIAYDPDKNQFNKNACIYGPRSYAEFKIGKGFYGHLQAEYMNTFVPPQFSSGNIDLQGREWVFDTMAGMKKEYRFFKNIKGTFYMLYNLHDPHHRSPYADRLNMRIGFEFPIVKRGKK